MLLETSLFLAFLLGALYSYFFYPVILLGLIKITRSNKITAQQNSPASIATVSFIITAFNEEKSIAEKIDNTLACSYPTKSFEILVASDGSNDKTNSIVESYSEKGVVLVDVKERLGKENAQKAAISQAKGEIIVFSDVSTRIEAHAIERIVELFNDSSIGAVSSEDQFISQDGKVVGEGAYVKYEMWLRGLESKLNSLVGLSGSFFAARKQVCENWDISVPSDFNTALNAVSCGLKAISDPKLIGMYPDIKSSKGEYQRKLRTVIRGMAALQSKSKVLNPFKFGFFSFQIFSHKVMRWLVPWFLIASFFANIPLLNSHSFFILTFVGQIAFYLLAATGWLLEPARKISLIKLCYFFVQVNIAIAHATVMFLTGKRITKWEPSKR